MPVAGFPRLSIRWPSIRIAVPSFRGFREAAGAPREALGLSREEVTSLLAELRGGDPVMPRGVRGAAARRVGSAKVLPLRPRP